MKKYIIFCTAVLLSVSCNHFDKAPQYPDMVANIDPFSIGSVNASLDQTFTSQLKSVVAEVFFYPRENEVVLEWNHNLGQYWQFWDKTARQHFIEAINQYKEDFANQNLTTKYNKSKAVYGKVKARLQWKTLKFSATYRASPSIELGYRFRDNAPYLTIHQLEAKEESSTNDRGIAKSPQIFMFFTRAQAEELAKLFDQDFLLKSTEGKETSGSGNTGRDEYFRQNNTNKAPDYTDDIVPDSTENLAPDLDLDLDLESDF